MPPIKQGDGKDLLAESDDIFTVELTRRAFNLMWEAAEYRGRTNYPKYVGGQLDNAAQASLEAVRGFRSSFARKLGIIEGELPVLPEEKAKKARAILAKHDKEEAEKAKTKGKKSGMDVLVETGVLTDETKKVRCSAVHKDGGRCLGPDQHKAKHKDKAGNRW